MRGQLTTLSSGIGRVLVHLLIIFAVVGAIIGAGLIDNTNPFWDTWNKIVNYGNTAFILVGVGMIVLVGFWAIRHFM